MKVRIDGCTENIIPPRLGDIGFDVVAQSEPNIVGSMGKGGAWNRVDYIEYDTGLFLEPEGDLFSYVFPRSSISKTNLILANCVAVIDPAYRGSLKLRFKYIPQSHDLIVNSSSIMLFIDTGRIYMKGDRIGQIVFAEGIIPSLFMKKLTKTERGEGGFGSTGS